MLEHLLLGQLLEHTDDVRIGFRIWRLRIAIRFQLIFQHVLGLQEAIDMRRPQHKFSTARMVKQVLEMMGRLLQYAEAEGRSAALDGVGSTKDRIELLGIRGLDIQRQQLLFHLRQQLPRLLEEGVVKFTDVHVRSRLASVDLPSVFRGQLSGASFDDQL